MVQRLENFQATIDFVSSAGLKTWEQAHLSSIYGFQNQRPTEDCKKYRLISGDNFESISWICQSFSYDIKIFTDKRAHTTIDLTFVFGRNHFRTAYTKIQPTNVRLSIQP